MPSAPKPPQPRESTPATAPDEVSVTGTRRAPADHALQPSVTANAPALETFEQSPQRGTDDARMQQTDRDSALSPDSP